MSTIVETHDDHGHHGPAKGLTRWLFTTNHKDIGTLYLWFSFLMLFIGGAMAMVIIFQPNDYQPRADYGFWSHYAGLCGPC